MSKLLGGALVLLTVYAILPTLVVRIFGLGVYKKGLSRGIALTFDDGPDPGYTPALLDLLKKFDVKATFFVLGSKAEIYPELILRIHQEGHLIGIHNYIHSSNGLMSPWKVKRELERSTNILERITGESPVYYRPPWGIVNIFDLLLHKRFQIIMWSLIVGDWWSRGGKQKIKRRLLAKLKDGAVILLHDSGTTLGADIDAPAYMIDALKDFLDEALKQGFTFLRMDEKIRLDDQMAGQKISWPKKTLVFIWMMWERVFHLLFHVHPIDKENKLLQMRVCNYQGKDILLNDGEKIRKGDQVVELHLDNRMLYQLGMQSRSPVRLAVQLIRGMEELLPKLAERIAIDPKYVQVKGLYGVTLIHRGTIQLGFTVSELKKGFLRSLTLIYLKLLLYVIHPQGKRRLETGTNLLTPKLIAISTKNLLRKYPSGHSTNPSMFSQWDVQDAQPSST